MDLIQPRVGFRWDAFDRTTISGGFGLFAGGNPQVWISNAFAVPTGSDSIFDFAGADPFNVPQVLLDSVAGDAGQAVDAIADDEYVDVDGVVRPKGLGVHNSLINWTNKAVPLGQTV